MSGLEPTLRSARPALLCAVLLAASSLVHAAAQQEPDALFDAETKLRNRHRETLHPGEPLRIVGLEQGDNDFRASTPALAHSDAAATQVDLDEIHRRRLAAYTEGSVFHAPPPAGTPASALQQALPHAPPGEAPTAVDQPATEGLAARVRGPAALIFMLLSAALLAWTTRRSALGLTDSRP